MKILPVNGLKKCVVFYLFNGQSFLTMIHESKHQHFCTSWYLNFRRKLKIVDPMGNFMANFFGVFICEGRKSVQAFEHNNTNSPQIHWVTIGFLCQNLRRNIIRCANFGEDLLFIFNVGEFFQFFHFGQNHIFSFLIFFIF